MNRRVKILGALAIGAIVTIGLTVSALAQEQTPPPTSGQGTWQCPNWDGNGGGAHVDPMAAGQIAKALGITVQDLYTQRTGGKSIADIAKEKRVIEQALLDAALAPYKDSLALRMKYGYITQEQADQALQSRQAYLAAAITGTGATTPAGAGMMGGFGMMGSGQGMMGGGRGMMSGGQGMMGGRY